jgi:hypothetical protein
MRVKMMWSADLIDRDSHYEKVEDMYASTLFLPRRQHRPSTSTEPTAPKLDFRRS